MPLRTERIERWQNGVLVSVQNVTTDVPIEVVNEETLTDRAGTALADLRTIANTSGTLSSAVLSNAARTTAKALIVLIRLQLRRLDATD